MKFNTAAKLSCIITAILLAWSNLSLSMTTPMTTPMTFPQYITTYGEYEKSVKAGTVNLVPIQTLLTDLQVVATPNAGALRFLAGKLLPGQVIDRNAVIAELQRLIGGSAPTPAAPAPTPAAPAPAAATPSGSGTGSGNSGSGTSTSWVEQVLNYVVANHPDAAAKITDGFKSWLVTSNGRAAVAKLQDKKTTPVGFVLLLSSLKMGEKPEGWVDRESNRYPASIAIKDFGGASVGGGSGSGGGGSASAASSAASAGTGPVQYFEDLSKAEQKSFEDTIIAELIASGTVEMLAQIKAPPLARVRALSAGRITTVDKKPKGARASGGSGGGGGSASAASAAAPKTAEELAAEKERAELAEIVKAFQSDSQIAKTLDLATDSAEFVRLAELIKLYDRDKKIFNKISGNIAPSAHIGTQSALKNFIRKVSPAAGAQPAPAAAGAQPAPAGVFAQARARVAAKEAAELAEALVNKSKGLGYINRQLEDLEENKDNYDASVKAAIKSAIEQVFARHITTEEERKRLFRNYQLNGDFGDTKWLQNKFPGSPAPSVTPPAASAASAPTSPASGSAAGSPDGSGPVPMASTAPTGVPAAAPMPTQTSTPAPSVTPPASAPAATSATSGGGSGGSAGTAAVVNKFSGSNKIQRVVRRAELEKSIEKLLTKQKSQALKLHEVSALAVAQNDLQLLTEVQKSLGE
jgi:hypothetical protein